MRIGFRIHPSAFVDPTAVLSPSVRVHAYAHIGARAKLGAFTQVDAFAFVGMDAVLGEKCIVGPHSSVQNCVAGDRVVFKSGCRVGGDGFGFVPAAQNESRRNEKKPQTLMVVLEDDVEVGANSCVDRGSWRDTVVGAGTKIDNLCQIGHNVRLGKHCLIAAQTGIAGSANVGDEVMMGGQTGVAQYVTIGDFCRIAGKSGVFKNLPKGSVVGGYPAVPIREFHRMTIINKKRNARPSSALPSSTTTEQN